MGRGPREKPERLAKKLLTIRQMLGLSQTDMLKCLEGQDRMSYYRISEFESGKGEPSLLILLEYARVAGVNMEDLVDDDLDLPDNLPGPVMYRGIKRASSAKSQKRQK